MNKNTPNPNLLHPDKPLTEQMVERLMAGRLGIDLRRKGYTPVGAPFGPTRPIPTAALVSGRQGE